MNVPEILEVNDENNNRKEDEKEKENETLVGGEEVDRFR